MASQRSAARISTCHPSPPLRPHRPQWRHNAAPPGSRHATLRPHCAHISLNGVTTQRRKDLDMPPFALTAPTYASMPSQRSAAKIPTCLLGLTGVTTQRRQDLDMPPFADSCAKIPTCLLGLTGVTTQRRQDLDMPPFADS